MHLTMQERLTSMIRGGLAVTLASTLMVPAAALANPSQDAAADQNTASGQSQQSAAEGENASASLSDDELQALLTPLSGQENTDDQAKSLLTEDQQDPNEQVTIIVELEDGGTQGVSLFSNIFGTQAQDRHNYFKDCIRQVAAQQNGSDDNGGIQLFSNTSDDGSVEELYDYYNAIDGFAIKAPAGTLDSIKAMDGVKNAFIEVVHEIPADQGEQASGLVTDASTELVTDADDEATATTAKNESSLAMTGADKATQTGKGQTIAIIDSGLDTDHEAFTGELDESSLALTQDDVTKLKTQVQGKDATYVSEKIPFAYDYADNDGDVNPSSLSGMEHGTHVAGIAAANSGEIRGTAPDAQIIDMKVAMNSTGGLPDSAILAALDDCVIIKPDTVNMSLGSDAGFSDEEAVTFGTALENVRQTGATVNVAAGNAYSAAYQNKSGSNLPYATDPDSSVMSTPAAIDDSFAVASVNNTSVQNAFFAGDGSKIAYSVMQIYEGGAGQDLSALADGEYEFVDGGVGSSSDKSNLSKAYNGSLAGKIVLVQRGGEEKGSKISFTDKVKNMQDLNASAIIIYNNVDGAITNAAVQGLTEFPPTATISKADGEKLLAQEKKTLTLKRNTKADEMPTYTMSDFSSWGVTPDLKLKPEVTAPGGNIYSSVVGGYANMSGTSMATPQMAGISAQLHEYVETDSKFQGMSDDEKANAVTQLLMSTATPLTDPSDATSYYSPRKQGAGLANVPAATTTPVYLTVDDSADVARPKADMGESADGTWTFTITLHNLTGAAQTYTPDAQALSDQVANGLFQQQDKNWTNSGISIAYGGDYANGSVTVPANGTAQLSVTVTCEDAFTTWASQNTPNGTFVEGYALLKAADGGVDLSAPFMGFYGDWGKANVFDQKLGQDGVHIYGSTLANPSGTPLGVNPLDSSSAATGTYNIDPNKLVVSDMAYSSAPSQALPLTGLLRNAQTLTYEYKDAQGNVVKSATKNYAGKSTYSASAGAIYYAEARVGYTNFDGYDNDGAKLADGTYTLEEKATVAGDGTEQALEKYTIQYDTTAPVISNAKLTGEGDDRVYSFDVTDASYLAAFDFHDPVSGGYFYRVLEKDMPEPTVNEDGTKTWHFEVKAADVEKAWDSAMASIGSEDPMPNAIALYAWDYGLNPSKRTTAVMTPVAATGVTLSSTEVKLAAGQTTQLTATVSPEDSTETDLVWTSSDPSVVTVDAQGNLVAVANGEAAITVAVKDRPEVKQEAKVTVADVSESQGIVMSQAFAQVEPDGTLQVRAIVAPNLQGQEIEWSVGDSSVASITVDPDDPTKATVRGGSQIGDTAVTAKVAGKTAHMDVKVRPADYDQFEIDESTGTLLYYKGNASHVTVPNNVKIIGESAFQGCPMSEVVIPTSVERIEDAAFRAANALTTVTFEDPDNSKCSYIGYQAFYYLSKLSSIDLPKSVTTLGAEAFSTSVLTHITLPGVTVIPENAFSQCSRLTDVTISDKVTKIEAGAFQSCSSLGGFKVLAEDGSINGGLPQSLEEIGGVAFSGMKFTSVELPASVRSIGDQAFAMNTQLTSFKMNDGLQSIGSAVFNGAVVNELDVPNSVTTFGRNALSYMGNLTRISFGKDVPAGQLTMAIVSNPSLSEIQVPDDAVNYTVKDGVLFSKDMTQLVAFPAGMAVSSASYEIPSTVTSIEPYAFYHVRQISSVTFNKGLKNIGDSAFMGDVLTSADLPDSLETIGGYAFMGNALTSLNIGGAQTIGNSAFYANQNLVDVNFRTDLNRLVTIGSNAFGEDKQIRELVFPDSLTEIGGLSFANMPNLEKVHIGAGMTGSLEKAFTGDNKLAELTVSPGNQKYTADENVLYGKEADGLHLVLSLPTNTFESYDVLPGTTVIESQALRNNKNLKHVTLPEGLREIKTGAFNGCPALADSEMVFPASLVTMNDQVSTIGTIDFAGTNLTGSFTQASDHVIIRSGNGVQFSTGFYGKNSGTAYFGSGVTSVSFSNSIPNTLVLPAGLTNFSVAGGAFNVDSDPDKTAAGLVNKYVYVPADDATVKDSVRSALSATLEKMKNNTFGWQGKLPKDFDVNAWLDGTKADDGTITPGHIVTYTPMEISLTADGSVKEGSTVKLTAEATGGVAGKKQIRFVQPQADGTVKALSEWTDVTPNADGKVSATFDWEASDAGMAPRAEVRDATKYSVQANLGFDVLPEVNFNLGGGSVTVEQGEAGPTFSVSATAVEGVTASYQWYCDGQAIEGATGASFMAPTGEAGSHAYNVVVTFNNGTSSTTVSSESATVVVQAPKPALDMSKLGPALGAAQGPLNAESEYTPESWKVFKAAYDAAYQAAANAQTQEQIDAACEALTSAQAALAKVADVPVAPETKQLEEVIASAEQLNEADYTPASWAVFSAALEAAKSVQANPGSQAAVDATIAALQSARAALMEASEEPSDQVSTDVLSEVLKVAEGLDSAKYTEESWTAYAAALETAKAQLANPTSQDDVDAAVVALFKAQAALAPVDPTPAPDPDQPDQPDSVDKSKLETGLDHVKQGIAGLTESDYTVESWKALQDAIANAEAVLSNDDATQDEVDAAVSGLMAAYQGLAKAETPDNPDQPGDNTGGDNGGSNGATDGTDNGSGNGNANANGTATSGNAGGASGKAASASGALSQTGDMAPVAPIVGGGLIAALGAIISAAALRLRKRNQ